MVSNFTRNLLLLFLVLILSNGIMRQKTAVFVDSIGNVEYVSKHFHVNNSGLTTPREIIQSVINSMRSNLRLSLGEVNIKLLSGINESVADEKRTVVPFARELQSPSTDSDCKNSNDSCNYIVNETTETECSVVENEVLSKEEWSSEKQSETSNVKSDEEKNIEEINISDAVKKELSGGVTSDITDKSQSTEENMSKADIGVHSALANNNIATKIQGYVQSVVAENEGVNKNIEQEAITDTIAADHDVSNSMYEQAKINTSSSMVVSELSGHTSNDLNLEQTSENIEQIPLEEIPIYDDDNMEVENDDPVVHPIIDMPIAPGLPDNETGPENGINGGIRCLEVDSIVNSEKITAMSTNRIVFKLSKVLAMWFKGNVVPYLRGYSVVDWECVSVDFNRFFEQHEVECINSVFGEEMVWRGDSFYDKDCYFLMDVNCDGVEAQKAISDLASIEGVMSAEAEYEFADIYPNWEPVNIDSSNEYKFAKDIYGQSVPADLSSPLVVAVLDSGLDYSNPDIDSCLWENEYYGILYEKDTEYLCGADYSYGEPLLDTMAGGTYISGVIAGEIGINPSGVNIMAVKPFNKNGMIDTLSLTRSIIFAVDRGARLININMNIPDIQIVKDALLSAIKAGCVVVTRSDDCNAANVITGYENVLYGDIRKFEWVYSSYVIAKNNILSLLSKDSTTVRSNINNGYTVINGSALATAVVSGKLAKYLVENPKSSIYNALRNIEDGSVKLRDNDSVVMQDDDFE